MSSAKLLDVSYIPVPAAASAPPPEPIKLSAFDAQWVVFPVIQRVLFFEGAQLPPFPSLLQALKNSLADTLGRFRPLAGQLVFLPSSGDVAIDCSPAAVGRGVKFVAAESGADIRRLAGDEEHDVHAFGHLVPELDMSRLPAPVLAVQATRFDGGAAVGVTMHHAVVDGRAVWRFWEAWAAACRGAPPPQPLPTFDRTVIRHPGCEELARDVLRKYAPKLPVTCAPQAVVEDRTRLSCMPLSRRTFVLDARRIERLKKRIAHLADAHGVALLRPPSTFVAIVALAWTSLARCKPLAPDDDAYLFFFADCRALLAPPVDEGYFGTCLTGCLAAAPARDLTAEGGVAAAALAAQEEVRKAVECPLAGVDWIAIACSGVALDRLANISGAPHFRAYDVADFGWGRPSRTELVTMNHDGQVVLLGAKDGNGVQVSVSLHPDHMDAFRSHFLGFSE